MPASRRVAKLDTTTPRPAESRFSDAPHPMDLAALVQSYGYAAVFVGSFLEGETLVALGGLGAERGYLALEWVMTTAAVGSFLGDQVGFWLGRRYGTRIVARFPQLAPPIARVCAALKRYDLLVVPANRFMYGLRLIGGFALGMTGIGPLRFMVLNFIGAAIWSVLIAGVGYVFGEALNWILGDLHRAEGWAFTALAAVSIAAWLIFARRRRHAPEATPAAPQQGSRLE